MMDIDTNQIHNSFLLWSLEALILSRSWSIRGCCYSVFDIHVGNFGIFNFGLKMLTFHRYSDSRSYFHCHFWLRSCNFCLYMRFVASKIWVDVTIRSSLVSLPWNSYLFAFTLVVWPCLVVQLFPDTCWEFSRAFSWKQRIFIASILARVKTGSRKQKTLFCSAWLSEGSVTCMTPSRGLPWDLGSQVRDFIILQFFCAGWSHDSRCCL